MSSVVSQCKNSDEDIFQSSIDLESSIFQQGYEDGFRDGVESGKMEGGELGSKLGFELGEEIGFYRGCVDIWKAVLHKKAEYFSNRCQRNIQFLEEQLHLYPLENPTDERLQDLLEAIRTRFRAISSMLSMQVKYEGLPNFSGSDESF